MKFYVWGNIRINDIIVPSEITIKNTLYLVISYSNTINCLSLILVFLWLVVFSLIWITEWRIKSRDKIKHNK